MVYQALPPPPQVKRWTADGYPTQAQVEYENREGIYKRTVEEKIGNNSASIQELFDAQATVEGALSVQWSIVGNINGVTGGLTLTGIKQADGTGATYNLEIDSNVTINGNLLVNGTISTPKIANSAIETVKIADNAVTDTWFNEATSADVSVVVPVVAGRRYVLFASYAGGEAQNGPFTTAMRITANGTEILAKSVSAYMFNQAININFGSFATSVVPATYGLAINGITIVNVYNLNETTAIKQHVPTITGNMTYRVKLDTVYNQPMSIFVIELKK